MTDPPQSLLADSIDPSDLDASDLLALIEASQDSVDAFLATDAVQEALKDVAITPIRERPNTLTGTTQRIQTGYDHIYVNINTDLSGRPVELFTTYGQSGGFTKSMTEAIHNLATLALRSNADPEDVVDQLRGIRSPKIGYDHGTQVDSIPDAIGLALERVINEDLPEITPPGGRQSSLTQHGDIEAGGDGSPAATNGGHETNEEARSADAVESEGNPSDGTETDIEGESAPTGDVSSEDPLNTPDEVSVSGEADPEIEPEGAPDAEPGTDPHLEDESSPTTHQSSRNSGDTEPCPDCGSIDIFYSEGCKTCQSCGWSECG